MSFRCLLLGFALVLLATEAAAQPATHPDHPETTQILREARAEARDIQSQARAMAELAWPDQGPVDPLLASAARHDIVLFGHHGLAALRASLQRVDKLYTADVTAALIGARWQKRGGDPPEYLPGLVDALWYGSVEAQRLAMIEVARAGFPASVLPIIDAARTSPQLSAPAVHALSRMGDARSRFFLADVLKSGPPDVRRQAAIGLAHIGRMGLPALRESSRVDDPLTRTAAIDALLPIATFEDLTLLFEYPQTHADDDAALLDRVRLRAVEVENEYQRQVDEAAAGGR